MKCVEKQPFGPGNYKTASDGDIHFHPLLRSQELTAWKRELAAHEGFDDDLLMRT